MSDRQKSPEAGRALPADPLQNELEPKERRTSLKGLWADLAVSLAAEEIEANQREMWRNLPRDDV